MHNIVVAIIFIGLLSGCATTAATLYSRVKQPAGLDNICYMFAIYPSWKTSTFNSSKRWQVPVALMMAFVYQESKFQAEARPLDKYGRQRSSAYGYPQAINATWNSYKQQTKNFSHRRNNFQNSMNFIGWYITVTNKVNGIAKNNVRSHYLNYHEGQTNYRRGSYLSKPWLLNVANKVATRADMYASQLQKCNANTATQYNPQPQSKQNSPVLYPTWF